MAFTDTFKNLMLTAGATAGTYIGLVNAAGNEISGGTPAYARKAAGWGTAATGAIAPSADLVFDVPAETTVAGWRVFSAATDGTNYGGEDLTPQVFSAQGTYTLLAAGTGISLEDPEA